MTHEPEWIPEEVLLAIHEELLAMFGGASGIRDRGLLESAVFRPRQRFTYGGADVFELAGSLAGGIILNHPFIDGNKRTGFMAAYTFLECNGFTFQASEEAVVERTLALAAGAISEEEYVAWLRQSCVQRP